MQAIVVNCCAILMDIVLLALGFPDNHGESRKLMLKHYLKDLFCKWTLLLGARERFSAAMAILHVIIRPMSTVLLIKNLEERSGTQGKDIGFHKIYCFLKKHKQNRLLSPVKLFVFLFFVLKLGAVIEKYCRKTFSCKISC